MLLFHEKCTSDVQQIINELKRSDEDYAKEFMQSLLLTYQNIYSKDYLRSQLWEYDAENNKSLWVNVVGVNGFPYTVLFRNNSQGKTIVLSVQYNRKSITHFV